MAIASKLPCYSLTDSRPFAPRSITKKDASFPPSTASVSPPEKDVHPSSITRRSYDTSRPAAPKEKPPTTIVLGDESQRPLLLGFDCSQSSRCLHDVYRGSFVRRDRNPRRPPLPFQLVVLLNFKFKCNLSRLMLISCLQPFTDAIPAILF